MSRRKQSNPKSVKQIITEDGDSKSVSLDGGQPIEFADNSNKMTVEDTPSSVPFIDHDIPLIIDESKLSLSDRGLPDSISHALLPNNDMKSNSVLLLSPNSASNIYTSWKPPSAWTHSSTSSSFSGSYPLNKNGGRLVSPSKTRRKSDKIQPVITVAGEAGYVCPVCQFIMTDQCELTRHIRSHNNASVASAQTNVQLSRKSEMMKSEENSPAGNKCTICSKVLSSLSSLDRHMLVHSGERPFSCLHCEMSFTTNGNMHRHMRIHQKSATMKNITSPLSKFSNQNVESPIPKVSSPIRMKPAQNSGFRNKVLPMIKDEPVNLLNQMSEVKKSLMISSLVKQELTKCVGQMKREVVSPTNILATSVSKPQDYTSPMVLKPDPTYDAIDPDLMLNLSETLLSERSILCPLCIRDRGPHMPVSKFQFISSYGFDCHLKSFHEGMLRCTECPLQSLKVDGDHKKADLNSLFLSEIALRRHKNERNIRKEKSFKDLTFCDCTSGNFPLITKAFCENSKITNKSLNMDQRRCYTCRRCDTIFPSRASLTLHSMAHSPERESICKKCSTVVIDPEEDTIVSTNFANIYSYRKHQLKEHKANEVMEAYSSLDVNQDNHIQDVLKQDEYLLLIGLTRNISSRSVKRPNSENSHGISKVSRIENKREKVFSNMKDDLRPIHSVSPTLKFPSNELFMSNSITSPDSEIIHCIHCPEILPNLRGYKVHIRMRHKGLSPFRCNVCDYSSTEKSTLIRHLRTHNGDKPYYCMHCEFPFSTKANCERHVRKKHGHALLKDSIGFTPESQRSTSSPLVAPRCPHCELMIVSKSIEQHYEECRIKLPHTCTYCPKRYASRDEAMHHVFNGHNAPSFSQTNTAVDFSSSSIVKREILTNRVTPVNQNIQDEAMDLSVKQLTKEQNFTQTKLTPNKECLISPLPDLKYQTPSIRSQCILAQHLRRRQLNHTSSSRFPENSQFSQVLMPPAAHCHQSRQMQRHPLLMHNLRPGFMMTSQNTPPQNSPLRAFLRAPTILPRFANPSPIRPPNLRYCSSSLPLNSPSLAPSAEPLTLTFDPRNDRDEDEEKVVDFKKNEQSNSNFRNAVCNIRRTFSTLKHCVRKKRSNSYISDGHSSADSSASGRKAHRPMFRKYYDIRSRKLACPRCDELFKDGIKLTLHMRNHDDNKTFHCLFCTLKFQDSQSMESHIEVKHSLPPSSKLENLEKNIKKEEIDKEVCTIIKKKRNSYADSPHKLKCSFCPRSFPWISSLRRHLLTHTGQKPFKCPKCYVTFSTKSNRERHMVRKHGVDLNDPRSRSLAERPHRCHICCHDEEYKLTNTLDMSEEASVATFSSYAKLIKHYKEVHKESDMPTDLINLAKEGAALVDHMNTIAHEIAATVGIYPMPSRNHTDTNHDTTSSYSELSLLDNDADADTDSYTDTQYEISTDNKEKFKQNCFDGISSFSCHLCPDEDFSDKLQSLHHQEKMHSNIWDSLIQLSDIIKEEESIDFKNKRIAKVAPLVHDSTESVNSEEKSINKYIQCSFCLEKFHQRHQFISHMQLHLVIENESSEIYKAYDDDDDEDEEDEDEDDEDIYIDNNNDLHTANLQKLEKHDTLLQSY